MVQAGRSKKSPGPQELVERARALIPDLIARQERTESEGRVSDETLREILDAELHRIELPARYGGFEYGLDVFADVAFEIGRGCGSTGWVYGVVCHDHLIVTCFGREAQDEIWGENPDALLAGSIAPTGTVTEAPGGYLLTGRWNYCSGIDNSDWMFVVATGAAGDSTDVANKGFALVPTREFRIHDNWHVVGLAGTGSKDASCDEVFVPAHRFLPVPAIVSGEMPGRGLHAGDVYKVPAFAAFSIALCAPLLGMAQGAVDAFLEATVGRETRGAAVSAGTAMAGIPAVHLQLADAAATIDAAKTLVDRDCRNVMAAVTSGKGLTVMDRARNKGNLGFAARSAKRAVDLLFDASGGGGLFRHSRIQRYWRDVRAGAMHPSMKWELGGALYGRVMLGQPPGPAQF